MYGKNAYTLEGSRDDWIDVATRLNKLKFISYAVSGSLFGYLVSGIFISVLYYPHFWILCALPIALNNVAINTVMQQK